ncbi:MAG: hypothetical protein IJJ38_06765 [Lachnospiraceae bacterium]|nr:hypothetical protein [Lachnospiraceae bacterium]
MKQKMMKAVTLLAAASLMCGVIGMTGCGSDTGNSASEEAVALDGDEELEGDEDLEGEDLDEAEEIEFEDADDEGITVDDFEEEPETPEGQAFNEYLEANQVDALLETRKNIRFSETLNNSDGSEYYSYELYVDPDMRAVDYNYGDKEIMSKDRYDGFDSEVNVPVRYVFLNDEEREEQISGSNDLLYLWPGETVEEMKEDGDNQVFMSYVRDPEMVEMSLYDENVTIEDGDVLSRETIFNKTTKELVSSVVTLVKKSGDEKEVSISELKTDGDVYTPDAELIAKLDSKDSHKLELTLDPGTDEEVVLKSEVGKGCMFYPVIYDGYTFYTDKECTKEADEKALEDTENDIILFGKYEEGDLEGEEYVLGDEEVEDDIDYDSLEGQELTDSQVAEMFGVDEEDIAG